jgi:hypothetical protein
MIHFSHFVKNPLKSSLYPRINSTEIMSTCLLPHGKYSLYPGSPHLIFISVSAVTPTQVIYTIQNAQGQTEQHSIATNFVLWSTGIAMNPFTSRVSNLLPNQVHKRAIEVDAHLRVKGTPLGEVYAVGDCATVRTLSQISPKLMLIEIFKRLKPLF